jgi:hypothetical protein
MVGVEARRRDLEQIGRDDALDAAAQAIEAGDHLREHNVLGQIELTCRRRPDVTNLSEAPVEAVRPIAWEHRA